ncbi:MAG: DUF2063 domain-containing protein [Methylobacterium sp.]|nr:DUF2063 domain-containing protein [Methylobacterium sp.]
MTIPDFQRYQAAFCAHLRNPAENPRPQGVDAQRMKIYSDLLFDNMQSTLAACFPVCKRVIGVRRWTALVKRFFAGHRATTPLFRQIPEEFLRWLEQTDHSTLPPFFHQLAHYEWVELALSVAEVTMPNVDPDGDLMAGRPLLAPALMLLRYDWPVQRISQRFKPREALAEPQWMLVFRDPGDTVQFVELNTVSARLVEMLQPAAMSGAEALAGVARELRHPDPAAVAAYGEALLKALRQQGAILGTAL